jgi:signal transduction histidine kinase
MATMTDTPKPAAHDPRRLLYQFGISPLLWAIPFALFFGTLYGSSPRSYVAAYQVSAVFAFVIQGAVGLAEHLIMPRLYQRGEVSGTPWWYGAAVFTAVSVSGSYLAAFIVDRTLMPGFLGSPRAVIVSGLFALLFTILVGGLIYARVFYRQSVSRAVALERMKSELARAELRALRAQVNPHFLFNTLNTIAALIHENPAAAEDVTTRLADVFRHALSASARDHTKLREELEFLQSWLEIERVRFGPRLRVEMSVEPGLEEVLVPSLLFQPLVENAVRYAVAPREAGGTVTIHVARSAEGRTFTTTIADDGPGFVPGGRAHGNGVGLESVRERLRLAGAGHAFELDTAPGQGTRVRVTLPLEAARASGSSSTNNVRIGALMPAPPRAAT